MLAVVVRYVVSPERWVWWWCVRAKNDDALVAKRSIDSYIYFYVCVVRIFKGIVAQQLQASKF